MENKDKKIKKIKELKEEKTKETLKGFEEVGEANFGFKTFKIDWWAILIKAGILILIILIFVLILK